MQDFLNPTVYNSSTLMQEERDRIADDRYLNSNNDVLVCPEGTPKCAPWAAPTSAGPRFRLTEQSRMGLRQLLFTKYHGMWELCRRRPVQGRKVKSFAAPKLSCSRRTSTSTVRRIRGLALTRKSCSTRGGPIRTRTGQARIHQTSGVASIQVVTECLGATSPLSTATVNIEISPICVPVTSDLPVARGFWHCQRLALHQWRYSGHILQIDLRLIRAECRASAHVLPVRRPFTFDSRQSARATKSNGRDRQRRACGNSPDTQ